MLNDSSNGSDTAITVRQKAVNFRYMMWVTRNDHQRSCYITLLLKTIVNKLFKFKLSSMILKNGWYIIKIDHHVNPTFLG